jgi:uncharacterized protein YcfJ
MQGMNRRRYSMISVFLLGASLSVSAQSTGWEAVKHLPQDQQIRVRSLQGGLTCNLVLADDDALVCEQRRTIVFAPVHRQIMIPRNEIKSVRLSRQAVSMLAGAGIGAGAGAGIGAGIDASAKNQVEEGHIITVLFAFMGGLIGNGIGQHSDFLAGPVIYRAP